LVLKTGVIALAVVAIVAVLALAILKGRGKELVAVECRDLQIQGKVEDIALNERGVAYVATDATIVLVDLTASVPRPRAALAVEPPDFRPRGISLFRDRLVAVDRHEGSGSRIIVFEQTATGAYSPAGQPIRSALLTAPEAVRATGPNQFYVANEARWFFRDPTVLYYDGGGMQAVTAATPVRNLTATRGKLRVLESGGRLLLCGEH
jgi:hypothetical protein